MQAFFDATYYTNTYKPNKNARISGSYANVDAHKTDFDSFRLRSSEIVDRLVGGKISAVGGIDFIKSDYERSLLTKAAAAITELWYIRGYNVADLDSSINIGGLSARQLINAESFRKIVPFTALALIQKSSLFIDKILPIRLMEEADELGFNLESFLTIEDALALFEEKGESQFFRKDLDVSGEIGGQNGVNRYINLIQTEQRNIIFELDSISPVYNRALIDINWTDEQNIESNAFITSLGDLNDLPEHFYEIIDGVLNFYIKVPDDLVEQRFQMVNIWRDETGDYGVFGSKTDGTGLTEIAREIIGAGGGDLIIEADDTELEQAKLEIAEAELLYDDDLGTGGN